MVSLIVIPSAKTQAQENHGDSLDKVLNEIMQSQNVSSVDAIDRGKIADEQLERLGDAVMGIMVPSERQHELMDERMGGEGSDSLRAMHIMIGQRYLGFSDGTVPIGGMGGMMGFGGGMMNNVNFADVGVERGGGNFMNMMNGFGSSGMGYGLGWIIPLIFWALIIFGIVLLVRYLVGNKFSQAQNNPMANEKSSLEILKQRYAKGEIEKEEFDSKKKDLE